MFKFPHIGQFYQIAKKIRKMPPESAPSGHVVFDGTVKLHGTNAGVAFLDGDVHFQSRTRRITPDSDNFGFAAFASENIDGFRDLYHHVRYLNELDDGANVVLFGEWIGQGINSGCAVHLLPQRQFVLFDAHLVVDGGTTPLYGMPARGDGRIRSILEAPTYHVSLDFLDEGSRLRAAEKMEKITADVESACPWGELFGVDGIGEGVVWKPANQHFGNTDWYFKTKGDKHKGIKRAKAVKVPIDAETANGIKAFVDKVVDNARLHQGLGAIQEAGHPVEMRSMGEYLKWIGQDTKREGSDIIEASGLDWKKVSKAVTTKAREFFILKVRSHD